MKHHLFKTLAAIGTASCCAFTVAQAAETVWLDSLDLKTMHQGYGTPQPNHSVSGQPLAIGGQKYERGVGTHAASSYRIALNGGMERFAASVGIDDAATKPGSVVFEVRADGKLVFTSDVMKPGEPAKTLDVDLCGVQSLDLRVTDAGDGIIYDHADWANARFTVTGAKPVPEVLVPYLLTPKPAPAPRLNGPKVYGARPGHPFLYRIPAQGERPIAFSASGLPKELHLDVSTGIITGTTPGRGEYPITLHAKNSHGRNRRNFKLVSGDTLSLTPQMGWNSWYAHVRRITDPMMREAADIMIRSGMADVGYQYVNIDACWAVDPALTNDSTMQVPPRDASGNIMPNRKFPDMKGMTDYIHGKGLKAGIYSSPGPWDCAQEVGAWLHEEQDAQTYANWGFDFLKYDWCSYDSVTSKPRSLYEMKLPYPTIPPTYNFAPARPLEELKRPYQLMGGLLRQQPRDIVFNLCQYGFGDVWKWGAEVGGQSWRTGGDLGNELSRLFEVALKNCEHRDWQKPGAWNDPDYIQIGYIDNAKNATAPCPFTPTEQYSFMSLWALMASPLFFGGDMTKLDEFTLNVLCNPEVIEVDQDPLGQCARIVKLDDATFLMVKELADGTKAVGLCNRSEAMVTITAKWNDLGVKGKQPVRDVWRQKNLGKFRSEFKATVPPRGVVLIKIGKSSAD